MFKKENVRYFYKNLKYKITSFPKTATHTAILGLSNIRNVCLKLIILKYYYESKIIH